MRRTLVSVHGLKNELYSCMRNALVSVHGLKNDYR